MDRPGFRRRPWSCEGHPHRVGLVDSHYDLSSKELLGYEGLRLSSLCDYGLGKDRYCCAKGHEAKVLGKYEGLEGIVEEVVASRGDDFDRLVSLVRTLRSAGGCPWDRVQTAETIKVYLIEEAHEVLDALESYNAQDVCGELGDLLFHILFLARIFEETGDFNIGDVILMCSAMPGRQHQRT
jgi:NTP pyrophosphatase (non-canonical NTP hydrolase)